MFTAAYCIEKHNKECAYFKPALYKGEFIITLFVLNPHSAKVNTKSALEHTTL
jgi:hypothetical protein